jgi:hypothetical protein
MLNKIKCFLKNPSNFRGVFCFLLFFISVITLAQPQLKFNDSKKNFGFVKKGTLVTIDFEFKNCGNEPVIITEAKAECSCTTILFDKKPIMPNEKGKISVLFDTHSVYDRQDRTVEIFTNSKIPKQKIRFKGVVLK